MSNLTSSYFFLLGAFCSGTTPEYLDYEVVTHELIKFSQRFVKAVDTNSPELSSIPALFQETRILSKLRDASTNNPDKFDLNWFCAFFKHHFEYDIIEM